MYNVVSEVFHIKAHSHSLCTQMFSFRNMNHNISHRVKSSASGSIAPGGGISPLVPGSMQT